MLQISAAFSRSGDSPVQPASVNITSDDQQRTMGCSQQEDDWENEGGQIARSHVVIAAPALFLDGVARLEAQILLMEDTISNDLVEGQMGRRHNTFAHRSRVLRQQRCMLDAMRASHLSAIDSATLAISCL